MQSTVLKTITWKDGYTIAEGKTVNAICLPNGVSIEGKILPYKHASKYLDTFNPVPSMEELEEYAYDSVCETPCGCSVEPDGHCEHGTPSWLLVIGLI